MARIPNAEPSPRIVDGVLKWYQGDTWEIDLALNLVDQDNVPVTIGSGDTVKVAFFNSSKDTVKEFSFPAQGQSIQNNTVTIDMDATATALFPKGKYTYDVYYTGGERSTVANDNKAVVE